MIANSTLTHNDNRRGFASVRGLEPQTTVSVLGHELRVCVCVCVCVSVCVCVCVLGV